MSGVPPSPWTRFKGRKIGEGRGNEAPIAAATPAPAPVQSSPVRTAISGPWASPRAAQASTVGVPASPARPVENQQVAFSSTENSPRSPFRGQKEVTKGMGKLNVSDVVKSSARPLRKIDTMPVLESSPIGVIANHFSVKFKPTFPTEIFHYDVVIQSAENVDAKIDTTKESTLPDRILPVIWLEFERVHAHQLKAATPFDGKKNCYTAKRLSFDGQDCFSAILEMKDPDDPDKHRRFRITLKLVSIVQMDAFWRFLRSGKSGLHADLPQDVIQALDVALRYAPAIAYTPCNRSFFSDFGALRLDDVLDLWYGHYQSLCLGCDESATLNIDLATKAFYKKMSVKKYIQICMKFEEGDSFNLDQWDAASIALASEHLKGKLIQYGTGEKTGSNFQNYHRFTAVGLMMESSLSYSFQPKTGPRLTIKDYMAQKNTKVEYPHYPVVHIGSKDKTNYVPLELCSIIPQAYRGKMEPALTKEMIKGAAIAPFERFNRIKAARDGCKLEVCKVLKEFGIEISSKMTEVRDAKRLHPPRIITKNPSNPKGNDSTTPVKPMEGSWSYAAGRRFVKGAEVPKFAVLMASTSRYLRQDSVKKFLNELIRMGEQLGMTGFKEKAAHAVVETMSQISQFGPKAGFSKEAAETLAAMKLQGVELVIVVIGDDGKEYASIKAEAEVKVGILTACIKMKNVLQTKNQTIGNYLLKLNSKLNGINFKVANLDEKFFGEPIIIFGADVTHPAPNSKSPSIAAVTASFNRTGMGFNMHIQPQSSRQEVIDGVEGIVEKMLKEFEKRSDRLPRVLIMFRDGVSEGYFDEIKAKEYEGIKKVCDIMSPTVPIRITFVVVKKRHHTRLQPMNSREGVGKFINVPPGTVVDTAIVHPSEQEFFLNSHVGIQGTSKPTRYHVIHDDNNYSMGDIQKFTYYMCYSFVRCTQPVSYPAATYYAHLAAYRARSLIERDGENADIATLQKQLTIHEDILLKYPMFFI